jgi:excisionase family DNA binding protein
MIELPEATGDAYLSTQEVADMLHVHRSYISDLRRTGTAPRSFHFGRQLLTRRSEVLSWMETREQVYPHQAPHPADEVAS